MSKNTINIVITAGGTIEEIDQVRNITNFSTGTLGSLVCKEILNQYDNEKLHIHYVHSKTAVIPKEIQDKVITFYEANDVLCVKKTVEMLLTNYKINLFIHSMAISDFIVDYVIPTNKLIQEIIDISKDEEKSTMKEKIYNIFKSPKNKLNTKNKISSKDNLTITLKQAPKIISVIKNLSKDTFLVGFKLLNNVKENELIEVAKETMEKNNCDLILANDLSSIKKGQHVGYLIDRNDNITLSKGKNTIAQAIVKECLLHCTRESRIR